MEYRINNQARENTITHNSLTTPDSQAYAQSGVQLEGRLRAYLTQHAPQTQQVKAAAIKAAYQNHDYTHKQHSQTRKIPVINLNRISEEEKRWRECFGPDYIPEKVRIRFIDPKAHYHTIPRTNTIRYL